MDAWIRASAGQAAVLRDIFGPVPFRPILIGPTSRPRSDGRAGHLARTAYDEQAFDRLPLLADALEDAGCTDAELLGHLRGPGPHVRGCWALDLILSKEWVVTEAEWLAATDPQPMLEYLPGKASDRKMRLYACACCRRMLHWLEHEGSRKAIEASELYADRRITQKQLAGACGVARRISIQALNNRFPSAPSPAALEAIQAARDVARSALLKVRRAELMRELLSGAVTRAIACAELSSSSGWEERKQLAELLRHVVGNPFRPTAVPAKCLSSTVVSMAQLIWDERAFDRTPILADALEDAGCTDAELLGHLRGPGPHVRGCWALDLVLSK
jgi:transcriptional regulator with XRE-family HTH domain